MLSRVAESLFWLSRYLERAENISRFIDVNWHLTLDRQDPLCREWSALVSITGDNEIFRKTYDLFSKRNVISFLLFDTAYAHSIISCLRAARENARTVREIISSEMWEQINGFHHLIEDAARKKETVFENPYDLCQQIQLRSMMIVGISNDTMNHGESWHFSRLGRYLERADKTSRILDVKYFILSPENGEGATYDDIQWAALLKATGGLDAYRQEHRRIFPHDVARFLVFGRDFPRSILHCLQQAQASLHAISGTPVGHFNNKAEQLLGQLSAELAYGEIEAVFNQGLHEFTDHLQIRLNEVSEGISKTFFAYDTEETAEN